MKNSGGHSEGDTDDVLDLRMGDAEVVCDLAQSVAGLVAVDEILDTPPRGPALSRSVNSARAIPGSSGASALRLVSVTATARSYSRPPSPSLASWATWACASIQR
jgi:hypothetical protein